MITESVLIHCVFVAVAFIISAADQLHQLKQIMQIIQIIQSSAFIPSKITQVPYVVLNKVQPFLDMLTCKLN